MKTVWREAEENDIGNIYKYGVHIWCTYMMYIYGVLHIYHKCFNGIHFYYSKMHFKTKSSLLQIFNKLVEIQLKHKTW